MSLRPQPVPPIPDETARVARAAFPKGNIYMLLRDGLGALVEDKDFATLFPTHGQPAAAPWRLALVTVFQFIEGLSDRAAADAVRSRLDWKYALSLELTDSGFDPSVLCEFRRRLLGGHVEKLLFDQLLDLCRARKWLKRRGRQRTDSTHVLAAVHACNRLQCAIETLRHALNALAVVAPEWLRAHARPEWPERYAPRAFDHYVPPGKEERQAHAELIGADGDLLLSALYAADAPPWLREVPAVEALRRVWVQQYYPRDGLAHWRTEKEGIPPARLVVSSPYDLDARLGRKRQTQWVGYKVYLTETCDEGRPHLITHVATTSAPVADGAVTPEVHRALKGKKLLPRTHLVDTGFLDAALLAASQRDYGVELVGPTRPDYKWQKREGLGFEAGRFRIDWEKREATCPEGRASSSWTPSSDRQRNPVIRIKFARKECRMCRSREHCAGREARRTLTIRPEEQYKALQAARERERTAEYAKEYARRAGVEGTISQAVRAFGARRCRYLGVAKTQLQQVLTATALNLVRIANWLAEVPLAKTRQPAFVKLMMRPAHC
ncbi:MAG: IS1182 family transposase [Acidobacteriota bacterium]|nr:IS1182 family transposase [Acidobacteriota bacterium]